MQKSWVVAHTRSPISRPAFTRSPRKRQVSRKRLSRTCAFNVGSAATTDIHLEIGQVTESVAVTAAAPLLQETSSQVGTVIEGKLLTDIPLNGRNFLQLNLLSPGVTVTTNTGTIKRFLLFQGRFRF